MIDMGERTGGPRGEQGRVYGALREAAGRLLTDAERDAVAQQVGGNYLVAQGAPLDAWPRPSDEAVSAARELLEGEAGVVWRAGRGWVLDKREVAQ